MHLPLTYFDVLVQQDENLVKFVEEDIKSLAGQGPFGSVDEYNNSFKKYFASITELIIQDVLLQLGTQDPYTVINEIKSSEEYKRLFDSKHADYLMLTNFCLFGKKTFYINGNLAEHLSYTNLEVDSEFIELPFKSCLLVFDDRTTTDALDALDGHKNNVVSCIPISVFCNSRFTEEGDRKLIFACWQADRQTNKIFIKRELLLKKGWKLTDILKTEWTDIYSADKEEESFGKQKDDSIFYEEGLTFFRIIINTILYLSSADKSIKEVLSPYTTLEKQLSNLKKVARKKKAKRSLNKVSRLDYINVGPDTNPISSKSNDTNEYKINKRFIVRGHWRNQPHGTKLSERKIIWVKPYYKGSEIAEIINKPYLVQ
jgi:hypothetical protein